MRDPVPYPLEFQGVTYPDVSTERAFLVNAKAYFPLGAAGPGNIFYLTGNGTTDLFNARSLSYAALGIASFEAGRRYACRLLRFGCGVYSDNPTVRGLTAKTVFWQLERYRVDDVGAVIAAVPVRQLAPGIVPILSAISYRECDLFYGAPVTMPVLPVDPADGFVNDRECLRVKIFNENPGAPFPATAIAEAHAVLAVWALEQGESPRVS